VAGRSHLSIGEVLSLLQEEFPDVTISKIRFLESQGLVDPERTPSGYRKFYETDIERLRWVLRQQRDAFLPLKVIKGRLDENTTPCPAEAGPFPDGTGISSGQPGSGEFGGEDDATAFGPRLFARGRAGRGLRNEAPADYPDRGVAAGARGRGPAPRAEGAAQLFDAGSLSTLAVPAGAGPAGRRSPASGEQPEEASSSPLPAPAALAPVVQAAAPAPTARTAAVPPAAPPAKAGAVGQVPVAAGPVPSPPEAPAAEAPSTVRPAAGEPARRPPGPAPAGLSSSPHRTPAAPGRRADVGGLRGGRTERALEVGPVPAEDDLALEELVKEADVDMDTIRDLERFGLITARVIGGIPYYTHEAAVVVRLASAFARHGVEARHLRAYKGAAEREAGIVQQVIMPLIRQRNPEARLAAAHAVEELSSLGGELRAALLRSALADLR